jgi:hypothetical protein
VYKVLAIIAIACPVLGLAATAGLIDWHRSLVASATFVLSGLCMLTLSYGSRPGPLRRLTLVFGPFAIVYGVMTLVTQLYG